MSARDTLAGGYAEPTRQERRLAASFQHDEQLEAWLGLKDSDPAKFATLPLSERIAVGHYETAKHAAESVEQAVEQ